MRSVLVIVVPPSVSGHPASLTRVTATAFASLSIPMKRLPSFSATNPVVPPPRQGSRIVSPGREKRSTRRAIPDSDWPHSWNRLSFPSLLMTSTIHWPRYVSLTYHRSGFHIGVTLRGKIRVACPPHRYAIVHW